MEWKVRYWAYRGRWEVWITSLVIRMKLNLFEKSMADRQNVSLRIWVILKSVKLREMLQMTQIMRAICPTRTQSRPTDVCLSDCCYVEQQ